MMHMNRMGMMDNQMGRNMYRNTMNNGMSSQMVEKFARYATMQKSSKRKNKQLARSSSTPVVHEVTEHSSSAVWLVFAGVALAAAFAYWYKYHSANSKLFNQVEATTLLSRRKEDECYVY